MIWISLLDPLPLHTLQAHTHIQSLWFDDDDEEPEPLEFGRKRQMDIWNPLSSLIHVVLFGSSLFSLFLLDHHPSFSGVNVLCNKLAIQTDFDARVLLM